MKFRSCLLFACMIVVPLLAMFSHHIPPGFRQAMRERAWEPARRSLAAIFDVDPPAAAANDFPVPHASDVATTPVEQPAHIDTTAAGPPVHPAGGLRDDLAGGLRDDPAGGLRDDPAGGLRDDPAGGLRVANSDVQTEPTAPRSLVATDEVRTRRSVEKRLAALGAISFDCQPVQGAEGIHRCSCRMAADPTGQLQRVFQSAGPDPIAAMTSLLDQVTTWKERMALQQDERPSNGPVRF